MAFFARIGRLFRGFLGLFASGLEERNPEALLEAARGDFRNRMNEYRTALARLAGIAERLKLQVKTKAVKAEDLERRIMANYRAGNTELAGSLAREMAELKADLQTDQHELTDTEGAYQANVAQIKVAQREFDEKLARLQRQISEVKVKEAQAEAASALSSVAFKAGDLGDTMKTVEDVLQKRYEQSAGKARLAADLVDTQQLREKEAERKALEQSALADFLASQGIQAPTPEMPLGAKEIGPAQGTPPLPESRQQASQ